MAKTTGKASSTAKSKAGGVKKAAAGKNLPASYYLSQHRKRKPPKDKNGDIIPE